MIMVTWIHCIIKSSDNNTVLSEDLYISILISGVNEYCKRIDFRDSVKWVYLLVSIFADSWKWYALYSVKNQFCVYCFSGFSVHHENSEN